MDRDVKTDPEGSNPRGRLVAWMEWLVLGAAVGVVAGGASAAFLALLDRATHFRGLHEVAIFALPLVGAALGWFQERFGQTVVAGNNLVIDTIHDGGPQIPVRMAPMVLLGTVLTHLFGGSAGREGTAVQMGASLADFVSHKLRTSAATRRRLLAAGVAGGFGSVFGTPFAGTVFGLELVVLGRLEYEALGPALVASVVGDMVTRGLGIAHAAYPPAPALALTWIVVAKWVAFAGAVAAVSAAFIELTHWLKRKGTEVFPRLAVRMAVGGAVVVMLWQIVGTSEYLGLGLPTIVRAFHDPALPLETFALKLVFTAITLGAGFLGGEVTPLFFVGAALGNVLARALGLPIELGAAVGMAATFATASNTPLALSIMAVELSGANALPHVAIVSVIAYLLSGHRSIYPAQRLIRRKLGAALPQPTALRDLDRADRPPSRRPSDPR